MQNGISRLGLALVALLTFARLAAAQSEQTTLFADDAATGDAFGIAVSVREHLIVVGSKFDDDNGPGSGAAYVYERGIGGWVQAAKLIGADTAHSDALGLMVATDGETVVVGAPNDDDHGSFSGSAYVFRRVGTEWIQEQKLLAPDGSSFDRFGLGLAVAHKTLAAGSPFDRPAGPHSGSVYIFTHGETGWVNTQKLVPSGQLPFERFGESLALSGRTLVIGAFGDAGGGGPRTGSAYVFHDDGSGFAQTQELVASDGVTMDEFGTCVAADRKLIVVGAPGADQAGAEAGAAYVFNRVGTGWVQQQKLMAQDAQPGDAFGRAVSVDAGRIAVGAYRKHANAGTTYVFVHDGTSWVEDAHLTAASSTRGDQAGRSIGLHAGTVVIGTHLDDERGNDSGSASVFALDSAFSSFCHGDGSGAPCPCANEGGPEDGRGCVNSTGQGAQLVGQGSSSASVDDIAFEAVGLPVDELAVLFAGDDLLGGGTGAPMGDGLRCAGGALVRFPAIGSNRRGGACFGPGLRAYDGWNAGDVRRFQVWYRDDSPNAPCGIGFNLSNAIETTFTP